MEIAPNTYPEREKNPLNVASRNERLIAGIQEPEIRVVPDEKLDTKTIAQLKEEIEEINNKIAFTKNYNVPEGHLYPKDEIHDSLEQKLLSRELMLAQKKKQTPRGFFKRFFSF